MLPVTWRGLNGNADIFSTATRWHEIKQKQTDFYDVEGCMLLSHVGDSKRKNDHAVGLTRWAKTKVTLGV